jgi:hypothetical protein
MTSFIILPLNKKFVRQDDGLLLTSTGVIPVKRGGSLSFLMIFTFAVPELLDLI